jgi:hypothetical protein
MSYNTCYVKNVSEEIVTLCGQEILPNAEYQVKDIERINWQSDDEVIDSIANDIIIVGDGSTYFTTHSDSISWLRNNEQLLFDEYGKQIVIATSRPVNTSTWFSGAGDKTTSTQEIGGGKLLKWNFANTDDDVTPPTGFKRKRLEFAFIDNIWVKDGGVYFKNSLFGSYLDFMIICPEGQYYRNNAGTIVQATADTVISKYVNKHFITGDCPMGDELNTESCSTEIPSNYKFWIDITVPDTDSTSTGHVTLEFYRTRSVIL